ncbi:GCN5-related N-acetyltransferase [Bacteroides coprosuis DSM 18011]|uniref:GCN5-related N-acetyltransferase n=1 Tax=Bacteroides coprosuis DSM 18011 TaxID=679937 RepID=F3ZUC9_9BACE|nr:MULTISPECIES: GNAT family N-acetyltransferase [Bacteroides]EGJ72377.1 GCN5-related N-acetyltransferase [Bacteroides coprosuis DSM 18011]
MIITTAQTVDQKLIEAMQCLIPQLTELGEPISFDSLSSLVNDQESELILAINEENKIVGSLALVVFTIPTGKKAFIEDVIVDHSARGLGIGEKLIQKAIDLSKEKQVRRIELSSRPIRIPANKLYQKMGFKVRDTNFYRLEL